MSYKITLTLFALLFVLTGVIPKNDVSIPIVKEHFVDFTEVENDTKEMELNKALNDESKSFVEMVETTQKAKPIIASKLK